MHFPQVCLATKVIYRGVLSSGRVQIDLWYKGLRVICKTSLCNNFSLFQLETKTTFYKQCWPYVIIIIICISQGFHFTKGKLLKEIYFGYLM